MVEVGARTQVCGPPVPMYQQGQRVEDDDVVPECKEPVAETLAGHPSPRHLPWLLAQQSFSALCAYERTVGVRDSPDPFSAASNFVAANVAGVQALLQACLDAGVPRVVQVSTDEVYGSVASGSS